MKFYILFLLLVVNSKDTVYAQSNNDNNDNNDPKNCSTQNNNCLKLGEILSPCNGRISPPPPNVRALEYTVDSDNLAKCMCSEDAYDFLSSCVVCFSNGNSNIRAAGFTDYQKACQNFGITFGPPIQESTPDTTGKAKRILIGVLTSVVLLILGGLFIWYLYSKRSKSPKQKQKPSYESSDRITVHHPTPGSGTPVSHSSTGNNSEYPSSHPGLFPPPGTIQQNYSQTPISQPQSQYSDSSPYYTPPRSRYNSPSPPPPIPQQNYFPPQPQQNYFPPQPQQPQQPSYPPFQSPYQRPPPIRNPYPPNPYQPNPYQNPQQPRNSPPPQNLPRNFYNF